MRLKFTFVALLAVSTIVPVLPAPAFAQSAPKPPPIRIAPAEQPRMTERQQEIMLIARNADGYITEGLHREFWSSIPFTGKELVEFKSLLNNIVDEAIGPSQRLGYETW